MKDKRDVKTLDLEPMIFGLDPSLSRTALASASAVKFFTSPPVHGPATAKARIKRVRKLGHDIANEVVTQSLRTAPPPIVFIEQYAFGARGASIHAMIEGAFEIRRALSVDTDAQVVEVPVSVLKKFITGKGNANKVEMAVGVSKFGWDASNDDEADAVALYIFGLTVEGRIPKGKIRGAIVDAFRKTPEYRRAVQLDWQEAHNAKITNKREKLARRIAKRHL